MREAITVAAMSLRNALQRALLNARARLTRTERDVARTGQRSVERRRARLQMLAARLDALSPLSTLGRGYSIARGADGRTLSSVTDFAVGDPFTLLVRDGTVEANAEKVTARPLDPLDNL
jgi:exodeoxyribonuclease VII large subunit